MGPKLKEEVERQLTLDLAFYGLDSNQKIRFDWSESCFEGHRVSWLDGELENFSAVSVFLREKRIANGWIDFVVNETTPNELFVFWDLLSFEEQKIKKDFGVPEHIWKKLSAKTQNKIGPESKVKLKQKLP